MILHFHCKLDIECLILIKYTFSLPKPDDSFCQSTFSINGPRKVQGGGAQHHVQCQPRVIITLRRDCYRCGNLFCGARFCAISTLYGMGESVVNWVRDWLSGRKQRVVVEGEESSWRPVISGVPQGSVLGPILFLIYINDLENEIGSNILKFADDTKMFRRVESQEDRHQLQSDLNKLVKWAEKWQMLFNKDKCKCLHIGQANAKNNYLMNNTVLLSTEREKDVGVVVSSDMKVSEQCGIAARKGNQILGLIRRNIAYRDKRLIIPLYMSLVRPHLEYCIQAWRPHMRKDIDKLERVQRRATRLISEISQLSYEERLQQCRLTTLETRRIRGDQIEVFKIMHGYEGLNKDMFFRIKNDSITRGHSLALVKSHSRLDIRKYTFSQRVVNDWNKLPEECINATSVNMFKNKIDQYYLKTRRE